MAEAKQIDSLWLGADIVTMRDGHYNLIADGALAVDNGELIWVGPRSELPDFAPRTQQQFDGGIITPGLVDCHTHLVFGGDRSQEFEQRLNGVSYAEIAAQGGGILSTVRATRSASQQELVASARWRLDRLLAEGVTTVEIKSGYGLDETSELTMLRAIRELAETVPADVLSTCLAAHGFPPEFKENPQGWIDIICNRLLPQVKAEGLADAVDAFCEHLAFSPEQVSAVFDQAKALGMPVKLHAEQLSALGGATLAAEYGALSADHLEYAASDGATWHRSGVAAGRVLSAARDATPAGGSVPQTRRANGVGQRCQSGDFPGAVAASDAQYGLHAIWDDAGRGAGGCDLMGRESAGIRAFARFA